MSVDKSPRAPDRKGKIAPESPDPQGVGPATLTFNRKSLRVKEARFGGWFRGKKQFIWWTALTFDLAIGVVLFLQDLAIYQLFLAAALGKLLLLIWYRLGLEELPVGPGDDMSQLIEGEVLAEVSAAQTPTQLWQTLSKNWQLRFFVNRFGLEGDVIGQQLSNNTADLDALWLVSRDLAQKLGLQSITAGTLTVSLILTLPKASTYLNKLKLSASDLVDGLLWQQRLKHALTKYRSKPSFGGVGRDWAFGYTPLLNRFASNISLQVESGVWHLNLEVHEPLVYQIINTLAQPVHNSVALVGENGAGKTTLAYSVAEAMIKGEKGLGLQYQQIFSLNASVLLAQAQNRGELEAVILNLFAEAIRAKNIIIFLDDAHLFFSDETGSVDLSNILLPILQNSALRLLASFSPTVWQKIIAKNPDVASQFSYQAISEPDEATTLAVLQDQAILIESQTRTTITFQAIREAYSLANRYNTEQVNPGRSIKFLLAAANYTQSGLVTAGSVQQSVESTYGVKVSEASQVEKSQLLNLEAELHKRMINQNYAVTVVADALRRSRAGVKSSQRPVGSFLFLGPTGVGKTQLARALAAVYFGGENKIIRVDMSEYANAGDEKRLLAADTGASTHTFLMQLRTQPFSVVLLDEIEKANPQVLNLLLQMLDEGHLTDTSGRTVSFKDAIIIATSNAGADKIRQRIEAGQSLEQFSDEFVDSLIDERHFLPELINRFDDVVLFRPLNRPELTQVVDLMIAETNKELASQKITVVLTEDAKEWLALAGHDPRLGARPLRRIIQRTVENAVAKRLLEGTVKAGQKVQLSAADLKSVNQ